MFKWDTQSATEPVLVSSIAFSYSRDNLPMVIIVDIWATFITRYFFIITFQQKCKVQWLQFSNWT